MNSRNVQKNGYKVLVVDDDAAAREAVAAGLRREGFLTADAATATRARAMFAKNRPDLIVVDINLPDADGFEFIRDIRAIDDVPIVICTVRSERRDRVIGLELGADDYVTKPFSPKELTLRVKTVLRRAKNSAISSPGTALIEFGAVTIEPDIHEVRRDGAPMVTTAKEFDLLYHLSKSPGVTFSRTDLLSAVWDSSPEWQSEATVTEHVRRLRLKIEEDASSPKFLQTVRGEGYRLVF